MNLDTPAGEAMIEAGARAAWANGSFAPNPTWEEATDDERADFLSDERASLSAALSATVECAACGGSGRDYYTDAGNDPEEPLACAACGGTGRRLAIKEMLDG